MMTVGSEFIAGPVANLLLGICAAPEISHASRFAKLQEDDWDELVQRSLDLRIAPLLSQAVSISNIQDSVPAESADRLNAVQRQYALLVLKRSSAMARINSLLREGGLVPVFLKGSALAYLTYPASALRPSRDVDILLRPAEAEKAQDILLKSGEFTEHTQIPYNQICRHHLFPLQHMETGVAVEVHRALKDLADWSGEGALITMLLSDLRTVSVLGEQLAVASDMANLMHLIMHAGRASYLDNGPLTLADLHYLNSGSEFDFAQARRTAERLELGNSFAMLCELARKHGARWVDPGFAQRSAVVCHLEAAEQAMLPTPADIEDNRLVRRVERHLRSAGAFGPLKMALSPDRKALALLAGVEQSSSLKWLAYPRWLYGRIARYLALRRNRDLDSAQAMRDWLGSG